MTDIAGTLDNTLYNTKQTSIIPTIQQLSVFLCWDLSLVLVFHIVKYCLHIFKKEKP